MKRTTLGGLFDSDRQKSEGAPRPSEIDLTLLRDSQKEEAAKVDRSAAETRKAVYAHIMGHPGVTENSLRDAVGTSSGLTEWLRDGIIVRRKSGPYVA